MHARTLAIAALALLSRGQGCTHTDPMNADPVDHAQAATAPAGGAATAAQPLYRVPTDGLPSMGDARALVTIVAFTDYECPFCRRVEASVATLRKEFPADVRVVVSELPLPMHDRAKPAALAALAAAQQGAYEPMRARLLAGPLDDASIRAAAENLGLDMARFDADLLGAAPAALAKAQALATHLGVGGTPTFFINGRRVTGAQPIETLRDAVTERLGAARALASSGTRPEEVYAQTIAAGADHVPSEHDDATACAGEGECDGEGDAPEIGDKVESVPVDHASVRGPARAAITIVEFADYQCPFCARSEATIHALEEAHPGDVRLVFQDLPLPFHASARPMAIAALAADEQGKFWEMHDRLFAIKATSDRAVLDGIARDLGLDVARFDRDLSDPATAARLDAEVAVGKSLGVSGTPTFFVNGRRVAGAQPLATFEKAIAKR